jgi:hypothetical protein
MSDLRQEHGRLVARLKRQVEKAERLGSAQRRAKVRATIAELIVVERRMADPLDKDRVVTEQQLRERITLMAPGAGD